MKRNWTTEDLKNVLWSDECPLAIFQTSNRQNDRVWAKDHSNLPPLETIKFTPKVMVSGMMSHQALSQLHFVGDKLMVNSSYYVSHLFWVVFVFKRSTLEFIGQIPMHYIFRD